MFLRYIFQDKITIDNIFDNGFHMKFYTNYVWVSKFKSNESIIKEEQAKQGYSDWITRMYRNGKIIYEL
jgi:hypothetical protein